MDSKEILGLILAIVATIGGLTIGGIAVYLAIVQDTKTKLVLLEAKNKERMALIEKGLDPALADKKKPKDGYDSLLWGLLLCGVALGALTGYYISFAWHINEIIMTNAMAMLLGGAGLLIFYLIRKNKNTNKASNKEASA